jgi:type II secretory pathway component PulJ
MTLIELIYSIGLSMIVMMVGYSAYASFMRADHVERQREQLNLTAQNAMARVKEDVRSASAVSASGGSMLLNMAGDRVIYRNLPGGSGVERRASRGRCLFKDISAEFSRSGEGVDVSVRARSQVHRRAIRVDLESFIIPRR